MLRNSNDRFYLSLSLAVGYTSVSPLGRRPVNDITRLFYGAENVERHLLRGFRCSESSSRKVERQISHEAPSIAVPVSPARPPAHRDRGGRTTQRTAHTRINPLF